MRVIGIPERFIGVAHDGVATEALECATQADLEAHIANLESDMREAAKKIEFEKAAKLRDNIRDLRTKEFPFS